MYFCRQIQYDRIYEGYVIIDKQFWWDDENLDDLDLDLLTSFSIKDEKRFQLGDLRFHLLVVVLESI